MLTQQAYISQDVQSSNGLTYPQYVILESQREQVSLANFGYVLPEVLPTDRAYAPGGPQYGTALTAPQVVALDLPDSVTAALLSTVAPAESDFTVPGTVTGPYPGGLTEPEFYALSDAQQISILQQTQGNTQAFAAIGGQAYVAPPPNPTTVPFHGPPVTAQTDMGAYPTPGYVTPVDLRGTGGFGEAGALAGAALPIVLAIFAIGWLMGGRR